MFQEKRVVLYYAVSPVHAGAGTAVGELIDNPIQRERHTQHPIIAGSGIKGAVRMQLGAALDDPDKAWIRELFGSDPGGEAEKAEDGTTQKRLYAGAVSFSDAVLLAFPVRSPQCTYVYATSPVTLARARRLLQLAQVSAAEAWRLERLRPADDTVLVPKGSELSEGELVLEAYKFNATASEALTAIANDVARWAAGRDDAFRKRITDNLVVLPEAVFNHFVRYATVVEPHVRIDDVTGTADDGGLFYTENLPPESILIGLVMASRTRRNGDGRDARAVMAELQQRLQQQRLFQIGGDATTGRGLMLVSVVEEGA